jgi:hypothetical protein
MAPGDEYKRVSSSFRALAEELNAKERYLDTPPIVPVVWGVPCKSHLGVPPSLSQTEKYNIEKVRKWAKNHPDKLDVSCLLSKDKLECFMGYPQGKWPNPIATRVSG